MLCCFKKTKHCPRSSCCENTAQARFTSTSIYSLTVYSHWLFDCYMIASAKPTSHFPFAFFSPLAWEVESCRVVTCERSSAIWPSQLSSVGKLHLLISLHLFLLLSLFNIDAGCVLWSRTLLIWHRDHNLTPFCPGHASGNPPCELSLLNYSPSSLCFSQPACVCLCVCPHNPLQPGMNGMEPVFGEAYGGHRGLLSPYPLAMSPQGGRTEYDQVRCC